VVVYDDIYYTIGMELLSNIPFYPSTR
jgi:hypothetical protein